MGFSVLIVFWAAILFGIAMPERRTYAALSRFVRGAEKRQHGQYDARRKARLNFL
jgi:hypothetical protein